MTHNEDVVLRALNGLVSNWYTVEIVAEFSHLSSDETQDALCELELKKEIEIDEWEDGIRVRLAEKEVPLTEEQKALVQRWIPLAYKMAMEKYERKWLANEDLAQHLCCELINIVKRYDPVIAPNFLTYACPSLKGARTQWHQSKSHLRGYKMGKDYENMPQVQAMDLDDPAVREEFEAAFCYDDRDQFELRDEIVEMLDRLTPEQAQAIILTEYYEMTGPEAVETARTTQSKLTKAKKKGLEVLTGKTESDVKERPEYSSDYKHLAPKLLIGITKTWPANEKASDKKKRKKHLVEKKPCPMCQEKPLADFAYCLYCDRWGMDDRAKTTPRMSFMKKTTLTMTKARGKYLHKNSLVA